MAGLRWLPLESNPDVMNKYVHTLGVPGKFQFVDVWGLDPDLLMMVPKPVLAVLLLYPITPQSEKEIFGEEEKDADTYFIKQTIGNACGTVGLIHAILGNTSRIQLDASKHLSEFFEKTKSMTPEERGQYLETDTAFSEAHESSALEGQTETPARDKKIDLHFVAFIQRDGKVYEMDGRRNNPICHGNSSEDTLLEDAAAVVKKFMARDPSNLNFTLVALVQD